MGTPDINEVNAMLAGIGISDLTTMTQKLRLIDLAMGGARTVGKAAPAASSYQLATLAAIVLPDYAKAAAIVRAVPRAATSIAELSISAHDVTPLSGACAVAPNGDIVVLAADSITDIDVTYIPEKLVVIEDIVDVATGIYTIPSKYTARGVALLMEAEVIAGTTLGKKIILAPTAAHTLPATTKACLGDNKTTILFNNSTDAVTKARVKYGVFPVVP